MTKASFVYVLAFGSNLGDKLKNLQRGFELLKLNVEVIKQGKSVETEPLTSNTYDTSDHQSYLNFVCVVKSELSPFKLYESIQTIENVVGHNRERKWAPRELDIDILFCRVGDTFENSVPYFARDESRDFCVPHRGFMQRLFLQELVANLLGEGYESNCDVFLDSKK